VTLRYQPPGLWTGMILTLLSGTVIAWVLARRRKGYLDPAGFIRSNSP
jgi:hypothetical protein